MFIFLHGIEGILLKEKLREEMEEFTRKHPDVVPETYDIVEEEQWNACQQALKTAGLFSNTQCIVIKHPSEKIDALARIFKALNVMEDTERTIILVDEKLEKKLGKGATVIEVEALAGVTLETWVKKRVERLGATIDLPAIRTLILYINIPTDQYKKTTKPDLWRLSSEIDKLVAYTTTNKALITEEVVKALVPPPSSLNIFAITDALGAKDRSRAITELAQHLKEGSDPFYLFSMFVGQFRNMLAPKRPGLHPYAAQKATAFARNFTTDELREAYLTLIKLERDAKSGRADMVDGLYSFVFSLKS